MRKSIVGLVAVATALVTLAVAVFANAGANAPAHQVVTVIRVGIRDPHVGQLLHVPASWRRQHARDYQWFRCNPANHKCAAIRHSNHWYYRVQAADFGHVLLARAVIGNAAVVSAPTAVVSGATPVNTALPTIADGGQGGGSITSPVSGDVLTGSDGTWKHALGFTHEWFDCVPSGGTVPGTWTTGTEQTFGGLTCAPGPNDAATPTTGLTYTLSDADVGFEVVFEVTAYNTANCGGATGCSNP